MPKITLDIKYNKNEDLLISPAELRERYMWGVSVKNQDGSEIPDNILKYYILAAQEEISHFLNLKLKKQVINEQLDFNQTDWKRWGYLKCTYPVVCPMSLQGFLNTVKQIDYPTEWLSSKKINDGGELHHRNLYTIPAGNSTAHSSAVIYSGIIPQLGLVGSQSIPNYWTVKYVTGFDVIPRDIIEVVGKAAAINMFHISGDLILGAGIASFSLGLDGLSQSISSTSSATNAGYGARIIGYSNDIKRQMPLLKDYYRGFAFGVL